MSTSTHRPKKGNTADPLQNGTQQAIQRLGSGLLIHASNTDLRKYVHTEARNRQELYRQLVRLIFRLIFLFIAEERDLLFPQKASKKSKSQYTKNHSLQSIWQMSIKEEDVENEQVWNELVWLMEKLHDGSASIGIPALGSFLWKSSSCSLLAKAKCSNIHTIEAIQALHRTTDWQTIDARALSAAYESLLELHLEIDTEKWSIDLSTQTGHERKSTGSYYTPTALVECLLKATLDPAIEKACGRECKKEHALLQLRICDPSCGSGLFLVAAARHLAIRLAKARSGLQEPNLDCIHQAIRDVVQECIFGVDINPMSTELCKISLWMETNACVDVFSSLRSQIQCGNALLGIPPERIKDGIHPSFFTLVKDHDEKIIRNRIAAKNRKEYKKSASVSKNQADKQSNTTSDVLLAAMLWRKTSAENWESAAPTQQVFASIVNGTSHLQTMKYVQRLKAKHLFFHWHLAFPNVFAEGGFDVIIGNPPYLDSEYLTKNLPYERMAITNLYTSARGNWDIYIPFTELGIRLLKPGGFQAFVTPNKILGAKYSAALHQEYFFTQQLRSIHDFSHLSLFDGASVAVVIVVTEKKEASPQERILFYQYRTSPKSISAHTQTTVTTLKKLPAGFISFPITSPEPALLAWLNHRTSFSDIAQVCDGATAGEAYEIQPMVQSGTDTDWSSTNTLKLVNTGTIDPFVLFWNQKSITYLGFKGIRPVIDAQAFQRKFPRRYAQAMGENVVLAGMSKQLEAAVAPTGVLCGKSAVLVQPHQGICPYALTVLLNSSGFVNLYRGLFAMRGMSGTSLNIGPRQIELLPAPERKYLQEYTDAICTNKQIVSMSTLHNRLSLLGKMLHKQRDQKTLSIAEQTVRAIMKQSR